MVKTSWSRDYTRDVIDAKQRFDGLASHIGDPPDGQIPLGDSGIYTSPNLQSNEPVSVFDCEQYPDSPYCGGTPWTKTPVGLEPEWGLDECGVWVELNPVLGFTKLPPVSVGYRLPGKCREEEKPPEPQPEPEDESRPVSPLRFPKSIDPNVNVFLVLLRKYKYDFLYTQPDPDNYGRIPPPLTRLELSTHSLVDTLFPTNVLAESYFPDRSTGLQTLVPAIGKGVVRQDFSRMSTAYEPDPNSSAQIPPLIPTKSVFQSAEDFTGWITSDHSPPQVPNWKRFLSRELKGNYFIQNCSKPLFISPIASVVVYGKLSEIAKDWEGYVFDVSFRFQKGVNGAVQNGFYIGKEQWEIGYISVPDSNKYPPPPDQKRKKRCCMKCCNDGGQNRRDQDLSELLRLMRKIDKKLGDYPFKVVLFDADDNKVGAQKKTVSVASVAQGQKLIVEREEKNAKSIGIDHFPIYVPSSIVEDESNGILGDIGDLKNKIFKQRIESLAELQLWKTKNDYEIFGRWQEVIEIQDSDPNVKGNQPKRVVLPNMAKSFKEIILLLTVLIRSQGFSLDAILKMYVDLAGVKTSTTATEAITRDIQDYLDYPTITKTLSVPLGIKIPSEKTPVEDREDIEEFLQNSTVKVVFDDWTGEGSIHDMLLVLLDAAARQIQKPHT